MLFMNKKTSVSNEAEASNAAASDNQVKSQLSGSAEGVTPINLRSLLDAGAHFGHQTHRWNPRMAKYIFGERNGIHIIDLEITLQQWKKAQKAILDISARGGNILFVGTKRQARNIIKDEAEKCGAFSVSSRWLGGMLTNFQTIKNSIDRMRKMEDLLIRSQAEDSQIRISKKEKLNISRDLGKLNDALGGIRDMKRLPDMLFIVDVCKESIAVAEAWRLRIPVVALIDTNATVGTIEYPIACNDDATRTISLFIRNVAATISEGKAIFRSRMGDRSDGSSSEGGRDTKAESNGSSHNEGSDITAGASV